MFDIIASIFRLLFLPFQLLFSIFRWIFSLFFGIFGVIGSIVNFFATIGTGLMIILLIYVLWRLFRSRK